MTRKSLILESYHLKLDKKQAQEDTHTNTHTYTQTHTHTHTGTNTHTYTRTNTHTNTHTHTQTHTHTNTHTYTHKHTHTHTGNRGKQCDFTFWQSCVIFGLKFGYLEDFRGVPQSYVQLGHQRSLACRDSLVDKVQQDGHGLDQQRNWVQFVADADRL